MSNEKEYVQIGVPDAMRLAELVLKAKGSGRTMADFSKASGVNTSTLSRVSNGKISQPLSVETLERIYEHRSREATYSFSALLLADGMGEAGAIEKGKAYVDALLCRDKKRQLIENQRRKSKNAVVSELLSRGVMVAKIPESFEWRRFQSPFGISLPFDFCFYIEDAPEQYWYFKVMDDLEGEPWSSRIINMANRFFVVDAWEPTFMNDSRTTFIFTNPLVMTSFVGNIKGAPLHSAFTAILVDTEQEAVIEEVWLPEKKATPGVLTRPRTDDGSVGVWTDELDYEPDVDED